MIIILLLILILLLVLSIILWRGTTSWSKYTTEQVKKVNSVASFSEETVDLAEIKGLPGPVKGYFYRVLKDKAPMINAAYIQQVGGFRAKPDMKDWLAMNAEQFFSIKPRAFVWNARISILPGLSIKVLDSYINGKGGMKGKLASIITIIDAQSQAELNESALQRFLAEAVWFPTALLPSQGVLWTALDANSALATITDAGITTSLEFEFNDKGEIVSVYTPARYREVSGHYEPTPWKGSFSDYFDIDGYLIPGKAEVEWHLKDGSYPYWKARIGTVEYK